MVDPRTVLVDASAGTVVGVRPSSIDDQLTLTIVTKVVLDLSRPGRAELVEPSPLALREMPARRSALRSLERADDIAIRKKACDVTVVGSIAAPLGVPAPSLTARLALVRNGTTLLDKRVVARGGVDAHGQPAPIRSMQLQWEHAFGGMSAGPVAALQNPVGSERPWLLDPIDPSRPAGFGPIGAAWPSRASLLDGRTKRLLEQPVPALTEAFPWEYFQSAPADLQVPFLAGDEWILLEGFHETLSGLRVQLPHLAARAFVAEGGAITEIRQVIDTLAIDAVALKATLLFRGLARSVRRSDDLVIVSRVAKDGEDILAPYLPHAIASARPVPLTMTESSGKTLSEAAVRPRAKDADAPFSIARPRTSAPASALPWQEVRGSVAPAAATTSTMDLDPRALAEAIQSPAPALVTSFPLAPPAVVPLVLDPAMDEDELDRDITPPPRAVLAAYELRDAGFSEEQIRQILRDLELAEHISS